MGGARFRATLPGFAQALAWSPDGGALAAATLAGPVVVLDGGAGGVGVRDDGHDGGALAVAWSPDGAQLISGGQDGRVIARAGDGQAHAERLGGDGWVNHVAWAPGGDCVVTAAGRRVRVWSPALELLSEVTGYPEPVSALFWLPGSDQLVSGTGSGLQLLDVGGDDWAQALDVPGAVVAAVPSPDGAFIASAHPDASVRVWNRHSGRLLHMRGYAATVRELAWSPEGPRLATGGGDTIALWSFAGAGPAGRRPELLRGHNGRVTGLQFTRGGRRLVSCSDDGTLIVWRRAQRGARFQLARVYQAETALLALAVNGEGTRAAVAGPEGELTVWGI